MGKVTDLLQSPHCNCRIDRHKCLLSSTCLWPCSLLFPLSFPSSSRVGQSVLRIFWMWEGWSCCRCWEILELLGGTSRWVVLPSTRSRMEWLLRWCQWISQPRRKVRILPSRSTIAYRHLRLKTRVLWKTWMLDMRHQWDWWGSMRQLQTQWT